MYKVMIVDDEKWIRRGLTAKIHRLTSRFRVAAEADNGLAALQALAGQPMDVVITDIAMPGMDGLALAETIGARYPSVSVAILSGHDDFAYAQAAVRHGCRDYLLKPVNVRELQHLLDKLAESLERRPSGTPKETGGESPVPEQHIVVREAREYIARHYADKVRMTDAAASIHVSAAYLSSLFKRETDRTFTEYLTQYRIERAKEKLDTNRYKIYEIAGLVGYEDEKAFCKAFKRVVGLSPMQYRSGRGREKCQAE